MVLRPKIPLQVCYSVLRPKSPRHLLRSESLRQTCYKVLRPKSPRQVCCKVHKCKREACYIGSHAQKTPSSSLQDLTPKSTCHAGHSVLLEKVLAKFDVGCSTHTILVRKPEIFQANWATPFLAGLERIRPYSKREILWGKEGT